MIRRRPTQVFSLAFLDCICCGFGAVILIFVLSVDSKEKDKEKTLSEYKVALASELAAMAQLQQDRPVLDAQNARLTTLLTDARLKNDSIHALLDQSDGQLAREKKGQEALLVDIDELKKEIAARQKKSDQVELPNIKPAPIGLPIKNNYIVFVIDCSGSMRDFRTDHLYALVLQKIDEVLDSYPKVEGIQFIDSDGIVITRNISTGWIKDSPETRAEAKSILRRYSREDISNPVPGITMAIRNLYKESDPNMHMGIFVIGDEFDSESDALSTIRTIDRLDPADPVTGEHRVTINAIGFPTLMRPEYDPFSPGDESGGTQLKFANLMRELCYAHGGTFIAMREVVQDRQ